jgi:hypothetical protein
MPAEPTINTELRGNMIPAKDAYQILLQEAEDVTHSRKRADVVKRGLVRELARVLVASGDLTVEPVTGDGVRGIEHVSVRCDEAMAFVKEMCKSGADRAALCCDIDEFCTQSLYRMVHPNVRNRDTDAKLVHAACVENAYADAAAVSFSSYLLRHGYKMSLVRCETLTAAADAASDGDADFCIIPINNSGDGRLNNFYRMLDEGDLKIATVVDVSTGEGTTRYALAGRSFDVVRTATVFEFSVFTDAMNAAEILLSISALGHTTLYVSAFPARMSGGLMYNFTVGLVGGFRSLLFMLDIFYPNFSLIGIYGII